MAMFTAPSIFITWTLLNDWRLPITSVLSSERFWIYLVEFIRSHDKGLLSWPGNIPDPNFSVLYLERLLPRAIQYFFPKDYFLILDSLLSFSIAMLGIYFFIKRAFDCQLNKSFVIIAALVLLQPLYILKAHVHDTGVIDFWFGRGLVASLSFVLFIGVFAQFYRRGNFATFCCLALCMSLTHFYSFILLVAFSITIFVYWGLFKRKKLLENLQLRNAWEGLLVSSCLLTGGMVSFSMMKLKIDPNLSFFWARYIPEENMNVSFFREIGYLVFHTSHLTILHYFSRFHSLKDNVVIPAIFCCVGAIFANLMLFIFSPDAVNIHFRIYIIEPLCVLIWACVILLVFPKVTHILKAITIILALSFTPGWLYFINNTKKITQNEKMPTVHEYLYQEQISNCQCTVYDPYSEQLLLKVVDENTEPGVAHQWKNALLHKQNISRH